MIAGQFSRTLLASILCMAVASCGGGGGSGGATSGSQSAGSGGSTGSAGSGGSGSTSTASALPPAPFGLTASADFVLVGWQDSFTDGAPSAVSLASDKAALKWSAPDKTYLISLADVASGKLTYTYPGTGSSAFSIIQADGGKALPAATIILKSASLGLMVWYRDSDANIRMIHGQAYFGLATAPGSLPTSGKRTFVTDNSPQSALVVDFDAHKVSGTVTTSYDDAWGPYNNKVQGTVATTDLQPDGSFVGTITVPGAPKSGELRGRLYGPQANEIAVYWSAPAKGGYDDSGWTDWRSVMAYSACNSCTP